MQPDVSYIPYATSSREQTGNIITFTQFEEGGLLSRTCHGTEIGNKYDDCQTLAPLISEEAMDKILSGNEYDDELTMLEDLCCGSQNHPRIISRDACYNIRDRIKQCQA